MNLNIPSTQSPRLIIIGGGFGGLSIVRSLRHQEIQIVLIDKNNYHTFQPLLYQVATAGLEPDSIAFPLRKIFKHYPNLIFRMAEVLEINSEKNELKTSIGNINYDFLVIATGSKTNFFGMESFSKNAMPMKSIPEALNLRSLLLQNFEKALLTSEINAREALMNIVVVGGGPTGVETAGALGELKRHILPKDYPELDLRRMNIHLVEAAPKLLGVMSENSSEKSLHFLKQLGVNVWLNTSVKDYDGSILKTSNEKEIITNTVIWSAGVAGAIIQGLKENSVLKGNRFKVDLFNRIEGYENIFAIGDVAGMISNDFPKGHPMVAPVAIQQGQNFGQNLVRTIHKEKMLPFKYMDKGSMATVGRNRAVVDLGSVKFSGWFAWLTWLGLHLIMLVGFRNKLVVLINWFWNYLSYDRGIRLIIRPFKKPDLKNFKKTD